VPPASLHRTYSCRQRTARAAPSAAPPSLMPEPSVLQWPAPLNALLLSFTLEPSVWIAHRTVVWACAVVEPHARAISLAGCISRRPAHTVTVPSRAQLDPAPPAHAPSAHEPPAPVPPAHAVLTRRLPHLLLLMVLTRRLLTCSCSRYSPAACSVTCSCSRYSPAACSHAPGRPADESREANLISNVAGSHESDSPGGRES
jgi:hypothetical protein